MFEGPPKAKAGLGFGWAGSGLTGAFSGPEQGVLYWPREDTREDVDQFSRMELLKRARWVFGNTGLGAALLHGMARQVVGCGLMARPLTRDKEWNAMRLKHWNRRAHSKGVWDVSGQMNARDYQYWAVLRTWLDGDCFVVPTKSKSGRAMFAFYEGHTVGTGRFEKRLTQKWQDGVLLSAARRPIAYRFLTDGGGRMELLADSQVWHCKDAMSPLAARGVTALKHAIGHFTDRAEIVKFWKEAIKATANWGIILQTRSMAQSPAEGMSFPNAKGADLNIPSEVPFEEIFGQGGVRKTLPPETEAKYIDDQRPHPNNQQLMDSLIRDIAVGFGVPPELVWNVIELGGANARMALKIAERFVLCCQQKLIDDLLGRMYLYDTAVAIKNGDLPAPRDPEWWVHGWLTPERMTVDVGRDGKLAIELQKSMMLTLKQHWGGQGVEWEEGMDQWFSEAVYREEMVDRILEDHPSWTRDRILPAVAGAAAPAQAMAGSENGDDDEDEDETVEEDK